MQESYDTSKSRGTWFNDRVGRFTASEIHRLLGKKGRLTYIEEKFKEYKTGEPKPFFTNEAMEYGTFFEPYAADKLKQQFPNLIYFGVEESKFFPYGEFAGVSPDGLIHDTLVEIKCPFNQDIHKEYKTWTVDDLKAKKKPYYAQIQFNILVLDLKEALFVSFDPRENDLHILKVPRDDIFIDELKIALEDSITILKQKIHDFLTG